jgi:hypothetical protein
MHHVFMGWRPEVKIAGLHPLKNFARAEERLPKKYRVEIGDIS